MCGKQTHMHAQTHTQGHTTVLRAVIPPRSKWWGLWRSAVWQFFLMLICVPRQLQHGSSSSGMRGITTRRYGKKERGLREETRTEIDLSQADFSCSHCPLKTFHSTTALQEEERHCSYSWNLLSFCPLKWASFVLRGPLNIVGPGLYHHDIDASFLQKDK